MSRLCRHWQKTILFLLAVIAIWGAGSLLNLSEAASGSSSIEKVYYVDIDADRTGNGTLADPWSNLKQAAATVPPGGTVMVRGGTYTEGLHVTRSGAPGLPITFRSYPGEEVILKGRGIKIESQSHIVINGFKVVECMGGGDSDNEGILVVGPGVEDIVIENNHIDHTRGSAISVWGVPWRQNPGNYSNVTDIVIRHNLIERANDGGYNEQITVSNGVVNFEIAFNELRQGGDPVNGGEGIDIKEGSSNGTIHDNYIHDINRRAIYLDGGGRLEWYSPVHTIEVYNNIIHGVPNGIAVMSEGKADVNGIKIYNNLAYDVEHDCAFIFDHPEGTGTFSDIQFFNNTFVDCATSQEWRKSLDLNTKRARQITIKNNILTSGLSVKEGLETVASHNIINEDPLFADAARRDYRLRLGSPAIDTADPRFAPGFDIENNLRSDGAQDIGAFEFGAPDQHTPKSPANLRVRH